MKQSMVRCEIKISGFEAKKGDFHGSRSYVGSIDLPSKFKTDDIRKAQRDCEIIARKLKEDSEAVRELLNNVSAGNMAKAKEKLTQLGLTEGHFTDEGGGLIWLVVIVVLLYATEVY